MGLRLAKALSVRLLLNAQHLVLVLEAQHRLPATEAGNETEREKAIGSKQAEEFSRVTSSAD